MTSLRLSPILRVGVVVASLVALAALGGLGYRRLAPSARPTIAGGRTSPGGIDPVATHYPIQIHVDLVECSREEAGLQGPARHGTSFPLADDLLAWAHDPYGKLRDGDTLTPELNVHQGVLLVYSTRAEPVVGEVGMGSDLSAWKAALGKPAWHGGDSTFWISGETGILAIGSDAMERVAICWRQNRNLSNSFLDEVLGDVAEHEYPNTDKLRQEFEFESHITGGGWYGFSSQGVKIHNFDRVLDVTVYRNFPARVYRSRHGSVRIKYSDRDVRLDQIVDALADQDELDQKFESEGSTSDPAIWAAVNDFAGSDFSRVHIRDATGKRPDFYARGAFQSVDWMFTSLTYKVFDPANEASEPSSSEEDAPPDEPEIDIEDAWKTWLDEQRCRTAVYP